MASTFGAKLDTIADFIFLLAACIRLLPTMEIPTWLWFWSGVIAVMKLANLISGFLLKKEFAAVHTIMNKITGVLLFLLPLTLSYISLRYSGAVVCAVATVAAVQEEYYIKRNSDN